MKIIGLCGGSGSGKGMVCQLFLELGIPSVDTDAVYREITSAPGRCLDALADEFGKDIIGEDGALDRKLLASLVFSGDGAEKRLARLNLISHKFILDETRDRLRSFEKNGANFAIVDAPVLFESGFDSECDGVICVVADREIRIGRIMGRDNITREGAERRIAAQLSDEELISRSDYVIRNNSDICDLRREVIGVYNKLKNNI
ncbi:MAG: dephospho-CoA kinase [Clostridia bacterium]|nr:dephospho-CoA kinase [Clostridia bacterium]